MNKKIFTAVIVFILVGIFIWSYSFTKNNIQSLASTFDECVSGGNFVSESFPRQCRLTNGQTFTEDLGPRAMAFKACATANIPIVSIDTVLDKENGSVEVRWNDPETNDEKYLLLPYDPLNIYDGCSPSAKRILQHVSTPDITPKKMAGAVYLARIYVAQMVKVNEDEVIIVSAVEKEWPNACLGMPGNTPADEFCAEVITPGYEVTLNAKGQEFIYRTNMDGSVIRPAN